MVVAVATLLLLATTVTAFTTSSPQQQSNTCAMTSASKFRSVRRILPAPSPHWVGDGFHVFPVFADLAFTKEISPLLMFDYAAPKQFPARPGKHPLGVGRHPHKGFETVTIAFQGEVEHKDSTGKSGVIKPGDVQWMTAGRGIIHQEFHSNEFTANGGTFEMCQLWVNLPKKHKRTKPGYQPILDKKIPVVSLPLGAEGDNVLGTARLIAGDLGETKGAAKTFSPVNMWDISLKHLGSEVDLPYPADHSCIVFVRRGGVEVLSGEEDNLKSEKLGPQDVALMRNDGGEKLRIRVTKPDSSVVIMGGEPIDEPIAAQGPFVMNTNQEISEAIMEYRSGQMGR
jgi:redox-sensitive bicupin YhaK (pirin superfamily)